MLFTVHKITACSQYFDCFSFCLLLLFRVSSVLNRDVNQYGKKFMFDECEDTCWNSDQVSVNCHANYKTMVCSGGRGGVE